MIAKFFSRGIRNLFAACFKGESAGDSASLLGRAYAASHDTTELGLVKFSAARKEAVNQHLHRCGCCCPGCLEQRWCAQQQRGGPRRTSDGFSDFMDINPCGSVTSASCSADASHIVSSDLASDETLDWSGSMAISSNTRSSSTTTIATSARDRPSVDSCCETAVPPLPRLNPGVVPAGAKLLQGPSAPDYVSVWQLLRGHSVEVVYVIPFHSSDTAAELAAADKCFVEADTGDVSYRMPSRQLVHLVTEEVARYQADMALEISRANGAAADVFASIARHDVFVQPLYVEVRGCSLAGTELCVGHDREVVIAYPPCVLGGDAHSHICDLVGELVGEMRDPGYRLDPEEAAGAVGEALWDMARDLFGLMDQVHQLGYSLHGRTPDHLVFNPATGRYHLANVESVRRSLSGRPGLGTSAASDPANMAACGEFLRMAIEKCHKLFSDSLGLESEAYGLLVESLTPLVEPLRQLAQHCERPGRHLQRPTAAEAFDMLERCRE